MAKVTNVKNVSKAATLAGIAGDGGSIFDVGRDAVHLRSSWFVSCRTWLNEYRGINLFVNPSEVQWNLPRREQMTKTAAGVVRNTWRNRYRNTYYDEPTLNITFQAGNIMPAAGLTNSMLSDTLRADAHYQAPQPPPGLLNFYEFLELIDEPMLTGSRENYHILLYRSRIFPRMRLEGYFIGTTPVSFTDSAANGNTFSWTATFQVYRSYPAFNKFGLLINEWSNWAKHNVLKSEIFPKDYDFAQLIKDASDIHQDTKTEAARRKKEKLATEFVGPPDPNDPKNKKKGLVVGSVAGKGKTAQSPTLGSLGQLLANQQVTDSQATSIGRQLDSQANTAGKVLAGPGGTSYAGQPIGAYDAKGLFNPYPGPYSGTTALQPGVTYNSATGKTSPTPPFGKK